MSKLIKDLGAVSAYAYAVEQGYTGTEAEFAELMASYATVAEQASQSAQTATEKASEASQSASDAQIAKTASETAQASAESARDDAESARDEAQQSATTASQKAQEASQSAQTASKKASEASQSATDAQTAKTASETAQGIAESARDDAESARDTASQSAQTASEKAQQASASATSASQSASSASASAQTAQTAQQTATAKASEAQQSAQTATTKAQEASQSASESSQSAQTAVQAKTDAESAKTASQTAQGLAESARNGAVTAKTDAESARDEAQSIVNGITGKVEQIDSNTERIESLEDDRYKPYPTDTASGSIASFPDGADGIPLKSCIVQVEPVQDLHGYDSPWPAGGGKNKCMHYVDRTSSNGITYTPTLDGINVSGTATAASYSWDTSHSTYETALIILPAGTYTFSANQAPGTSQVQGYIAFMGQTESGTAISNLVLAGTTLTKTATFSEPVGIYYGIYVASGVSVNMTVKLQIESGSTATSWSPYSNICPISGWDSVVVSHSGVNIFNKATAVQNCYINNSEDGLERESTGSASTDYIPVKPNTSYYIVTEQQRGQWGAWYDGEKNYISGITGYGVLTVPSNAQFMRLTTVYVLQGVKYGNLDTFSINYPSTDHDYHPYSGNSLSIPLPQTVYGGTLDVTTGELVVDMAMVDLGTLTWGYSGASGAGRYFYAAIINKAIGYNNIICSIYKTSAQPGLANLVDKSIAGENSGRSIVVKDSAYSTAADFKSAMNGVQLVYKLAESITCQLAPTEIRSLLGQNNVFADTGDSTVIYRADTTMYINRKIAEAISALS